MKEKVQAPELRFDGFTDDWEERKLGEVATFLNGRAYKQDELLDSGKYKVLRVGNFYTNDSWYYSNMELGDKYYVDKGDLVYTWSATFGPHIWSGEKVIYHYHIWKVELSKFLDRNFTLQLLEADKARLLSSTNGSTMIHVTKGDMESKIVSIPNIDEQKQIGSFFKQLDNTITLHQRKLNLLKEQKKGYLQKMFPKNGAKVPELRFAGFADDWEERKLGEHAKYRRGSFPQPYGNKEWYDGEGAMPFVQVVDVTNKLTLVENTKQKISKLAQSKSVFVPKGTVVVTLQGSIGRVAITQYDSFVDRTLLIFEDYEKETDEWFWAYTIQKKFEIEKLKAPGGTIKTITKEALSSFDVHLPQFKEQAKIGSFFKQLDDTIALHQRKLDLLKEQKKGFLQKMFV